MAAIKFNSKPLTLAEAKIQQYIVEHHKAHELENVHMLSDRRALVCLRDGSCYQLFWTRGELEKMNLDDAI